MTMPTSGPGGRPEDADAPPEPAEAASANTPPAESPDSEAEPPEETPGQGPVEPGTPSPERGHQPRADWSARDTGGRTGWTSTNAPGGGWYPTAVPPTEAAPPTAEAPPARPRPGWDSPSRLDLPGVSPLTRAERRRAEEEAAVAAAGWPTGGRYPNTVGHGVWALVRLSLGFLFLWTFADALVGLDRPTPAGAGWLDGVSPTADYLGGVHNSLAWFFHALAGQAWVDWLLMISLAFVGVALVLGVAITLAAVAGSAVLILLWLSTLPLVGAPVVDEHIIYALVLIGIAATGAGLHFSLAPWWRRTALVRRVPLLR